MNVVVIDDSFTARSALEGILQALNHEVRAYSDSSRALASIEQTKPDLVFCDFVMESQNGLEVRSRLHQLEGCKELPFVMVSGLVDDDLRSACRAAGVRWILPKPFDQNTVGELLERLLAEQEVVGPPLSPAAQAPESVAELWRDLGDIGELSEIGIVDPKSQLTELSRERIPGRLQRWSLESAAIHRSTSNQEGQLILDGPEGTLFSCGLAAGYRLIGVVDRFVVLGIVRFYVARALTTHSEALEAQPGDGAPALGGAGSGSVSGTRIDFH